MKKIIFKIFLLAAFAFANAFSGTKYYIVATGGSDGNNGSIGSPWATFAHAVGVLQPGDTLFVRGGTHTAHQNGYPICYVSTLGTDGTAANPIVITGYPGETAILDGSDLDSADAAEMGILDIRADWWFVRDLTIRNAFHYSIRGALTIGNHVRFSNLTIHDIDGGGIVVTIGDSVIVEDCHIYNVAMDNENGRVEPTYNNFVYPGAWGVGIFMTGGGDFPEGDTLKYPIMRRNVVHDSWGEGITLEKCRWGRMEDNIVYNTYSVSMYHLLNEDCVVSGNLAYNTWMMRYFPEHGVYGGVTFGIWNEAWETFPGFARDTIRNNVIWGGARGMVIAEDQKDMIYANNTILDSWEMCALHVSAEATFDNVIFQNNIVGQDSTLPVVIMSNGTNAGLVLGHNLWTKALSGSGTDMAGTGDITADPLFTRSPGDTTAGNLVHEYFNLQAGSPAINAGTDVGWGDDIGAQQYTAGETPLITVSTTSLSNFGTIQVGSNSSSQSYTVSGTDLTANITITAPTHFQVSTSEGSGYGSSVVLTQSGGTVANTTIYTRFSPNSTGAKSGNITHTSTDATTKNVAVSGTGTTPDDSTNFYIKNGGNDSYSGHSDSAAWATISKLNSVTLEPGDTVFFNKGDTWREGYAPAYNGTFSQPIVYTSYGSGAKPLLLGSLNKSATGDWTNDAGNIWKSTAKFATHYGSQFPDVGNLVFDNEDTCGTKKFTSKAQCTHQGDFFFSLVDSLIYIYSVGNPASVYSNIEVVQRYISSTVPEAIIYIDGRSNLIFENLDFRYIGAIGVSIAGDPSSYITVQNCNFSWIGGSKQFTDSTRYGNGFQVWNSGTYITLRYCTFDQIYDAAFTFQGDGTSRTMNDIRFYYNFTNKAWAAGEFWHIGTGSIIDSIFVENNTMVNIGRCWSRTQRSDSLFDAVFAFGLIPNGVTCTNFFARNNIFYDPYTSNNEYERQVCIFFPSTIPDSTRSHFTFDYNRYYEPYFTMLRYDDVSYTQAQFATFQSTTGQEAHGTTGNPLFTSATDFSLQSASPCINAGIDLGYTQDILGNPIVGTPDIGSYEYQGPGIIRTKLLRKKR